jgi:hypothetical protein
LVNWAVDDSITLEPYDNLNYCSVFIAYIEKMLAEFHDPTTEFLKRTLKMPNSTEFWWIDVQTEEENLNIKSFLVAYALNHREGSAFEKKIENATKRFIKCSGTTAHWRCGTGLRRPLREVSGNRNASASGLRGKK